MWYLIFHPALKLYGAYFQFREQGLGSQGFNDFSDFYSYQVMKLKTYKSYDFKFYAFLTMYLCLCYGYGALSGEQTGKMKRMNEEARERKKEISVQKSKLLTFVSCSFRNMMPRKNHHSP